MKTIVRMVLFATLGLALSSCMSSNRGNTSFDVDTVVYRTYRVEPGSELVVESSGSNLKFEVRVGKSEFQVREQGDDGSWSDPVSIGIVYTVELDAVVAQIRLSNDGEELQIGNNKPSPDAGLVVSRSGGL